MVGKNPGNAQTSELQEMYYVKYNEINIQTTVRIES